MEECRMRCRLIVFLLILVLAFPICSGAEEDMLFPARGEKGLWGYINIRGEWVIEPQFYHATDFYASDYAMVESGGYGFIDRNGNFTYEGPYEELEHLKSALKIKEFGKDAYYIADNGILKKAD